MSGRKLVSLLVFTAMSCFASAKGVRHRCGSDSLASVPFNWCIDSNGHHNSDVMFYLHPSDHSPEAWLQNEENRDIRSEWKKIRKDSPTVISISFGPEWSLTDIDQPSRPALYPLFVHDVLPFMENKISGPRGRRFLFGVSMGGFNAAMLYLKDNELFDRTVLVCPAISSLRPKPSTEDLESYVQRHQAYLNLEAVQELLAWEALEFPAAPDWDRHDAIRLASNLTPSVSPIHVESGTEDEYGLHEGARAFAAAADQAGARIEWRPLPGGHCVFDAKAIANFLAR